MAFRIMLILAMMHIKQTDSEVTGIKRTLKCCHLLREAFQLQGWKM